MKMLIIEDDALYVELLQRYLEGLADEIVVAHNWREAEQHVKDSKIIWVDLVLPPETTKEQCLLQVGYVRSINARAVIFVVSGVSDPDIPKRSLDAGADYFAHKTDLVTQTQVIALMISSLMMAHERGAEESLRFLDKARMLLNERVNPKAISAP